MNLFFKSLAALVLLPPAFNVAVAHECTLCFAAKKYITGLDPSSIAISDLNGDGKFDIVVANGGTTILSSNTVSIYFGNGAGGFASAVNFPAGSTPVSVAVGNLNPNVDGWPDLLVSNYNVNTVSIMLGNGLGGFSGPSPFPAGGSHPGARPGHSAIGDFNGDTLPDVAVPNFLSGSVSILIGDGFGGLSSPTPFVVTGQLPTIVVINDFDGDANLDLAVDISDFSQISGVSVLFGDGAGGFSGLTSYVGTAATGSPIATLASGFIDGDTAADLVVGYAGGVSILLNDGFGSFLGLTPFLTGGPRGVAIGDLSGDMKSDIVVGPGTFQAVRYLLGDGLGGFSGVNLLGSDGSEGPVAIGDLNGDGCSDVISASAFTSDDITVYLQLSTSGAYGSGCAGSGGYVPALGIAGCPCSGQEMSILVGCGLGGATTFLFVGFAQASIPIYGCTLLVGGSTIIATFPVTLHGIGPGNGSIVITGTVPPGSSPGMIAMQAFVIDNGVTRGFSTSNGVDIHIQ